MIKPIVIPSEPYTVAETCAALGVDRRTLHRYTVAGSIKSHRRSADNRIVYWGKDILACYYSVK